MARTSVLPQSSTSSFFFGSFSHRTAMRCNLARSSANSLPPLTNVGWFATAFDTYFVRMNPQMQQQDEQEQEQQDHPMAVREKEESRRPTSTMTKRHRQQKLASLAVATVAFSSFFASCDVSVNAFTFNADANSRRRRILAVNDANDYFYSPTNNGRLYLKRRIGDDDDDDKDEEHSFETDSSFRRSQTPSQASSKKNNNKNKNNNNANHLVLAAALFTASTLGSIDPTAATTRANAATGPSAAPKDLDLVSAGTPVIETKIIGGANKIYKDTEKTLKTLVRTAIFDKTKKTQLTESVQRIRRDISTELTTVEAWRDVTKILRDYGVDLQKDTDIVVRPPSDWRRTYDDFVTNKRVNLLVNGEIIQIQLEHFRSTNEQEGKEIMPDDEWVLRVRGYRGFDANPLLKPSDRRDTNLDKMFRYERPRWRKNLDEYWHAPLANTNPLSWGGTATRGDVIFVGGSTAIALSYAVSYAYYLDQIEQQNEKERLQKEEKAAASKAKQEAAAQAALKRAREKATELEEKLETTKSKTTVEKAKAKAKPKAKPEPKAEPKPKETSVTPAPQTEEEPNAKTVDTPPKVSSPKVSSPSVTPPAETKAPAPAPKITVTEKDATDAKEAASTETATTTATAIAATSTTTSTTATASSIDDNKDEDDESGVKVVIEFDDDGKVVLRTTSVSAFQRRENLLSFFQALYLPWLGFFVSSSSSVDDRPGVTRFAQALWFPWAGIFFPKASSTTETAIAETEQEEKKKLSETAEQNGNGNNGVLPFLRALWFPWIGIFQGK